MKSRPKSNRLCTRSRPNHFNHTWRTTSKGPHRPSLRSTQHNFLHHHTTCTAPTAKPKRSLNSRPWWSNSPPNLQTNPRSPADDVGGPSTIQPSHTPNACTTMKITVGLTDGTVTRTIQALPARTKQPDIKSQLLDPTQWEDRTSTRI